MSAQQPPFLFYLQESFRSHPRLQPLILAVVDVDHFHALGANGSAVLTQLEALLKEALPGQEIGRVGNDSFAVLIRQVKALPIETVFRQLDRVRLDVEREAHATFSAGIVSYPKDSNDLAELFSLALEALHHAKKNGRNQVVFAPADKMRLKTSHFHAGQLDKLTKLSERLRRSEAALLREALADLLYKYNAQ